MANLAGISVLLISVGRGGWRVDGKERVEGEIDGLARVGDGVVDAGLEGGGELEGRGPGHAAHDGHAVGVTAHGFFELAGLAGDLCLLAQLDGFSLLRFGEG